MVVVMAIAGTARAGSPFPDLPKQVALVTKVSATSTFSDKSDPTDYSAWRAVVPELHNDGAMTMGPPQLWTAWCEGKKDEGIGETLTVTFAEPTKLDSIKISAGVWRTESLFKLNNQITSLDVIADGKSQTVKPSGMTEVEAKIGDKVTTLAFKIGAVKKGKANDTCISDIELIRDGERLPVLVGIDATAWAALPGAVQTLQNAIQAPDRKGLDKLIEFPLKTHDIDADFMGGAKDATVKSAKDLVAACKAYDKARSDPNNVYVDPNGCPTEANHDPDDDRGDRITTATPGTVELLFQSHRELAITWRLHWTDGKWKLAAIGDR
jgi:hypothetical protein